MCRGVAGDTIFAAILTVPGHNRRGSKPSESGSELAQSDSFVGTETAIAGPHGLGETTTVA